MGPSVPQGGGGGSGRPDQGPQRGRASCLRPRRRGEQSPDGSRAKMRGSQLPGYGVWGLSPRRCWLAICWQVVPGGGVWSPESLLPSMCRGGCGRLSARRRRTPMPGSAERAARGSPASPDCRGRRACVFVGPEAACGPSSPGGGFPATGHGQGLGRRWRSGFDLSLAKTESAGDPPGPTRRLLAAGSG